MSERRAGSRQGSKSERGSEKARKQESEGKGFGWQGWKETRRKEGEKEGRKEEARKEGAKEQKDERIRQLASLPA